MHDIAGGRVPLNKLMIDKRIGAYVGVDPTAPSMHVGHMLPMMVAAWMYLYGCHAVALVLFFSSVDLRHLISHLLTSAGRWRHVQNR